jgi:hypothetical protein
MEKIGTFCVLLSFILGSFFGMLSWSSFVYFLEVCVFGFQDLE